ncbi:MAG: ABC transporter permease [Gammaproteobacteria bacterium]|nr:ABC transporter permease [Gammaproteobacteria bacterium]
MGIGILIATATGTLQQALLVSFLMMFPITFLSGTLVPIDSMPVRLQYAAELSPVRHYMDVVRLLAMFAIGSVLIGWAWWRLTRGLG